MIAGEFNSISKSDIDALITSKEPEGRTIEYKLTLPAANDEGKREFLADASSLANAAGGDLIFGIREKNGVPESAEGLSVANADQEKLRLEQMLRDGLDPRIPGVQTKHVEGFPNGPVIVLRVPKSWAAPHAVKSSSRFFTRASNGKHQMDVREIKAAFLASDGVANKIATFRSERVGRILIGETPARLDALPKIVLHLLPIRSFSEPEVIDLNQIRIGWDVNTKPMGRLSQWSGLVFNFNGLFCYGPGAGNMPNRGYFQLFRNGAFEAAFVGVIEGKLLSGSYIEQELIKEGHKYLKFFDGLDLGPMFVALSVVSAKGFTIVQTLNSPYPFPDSHFFPIEDEVLLAPEALNVEKGGDIRALLHRALDSIWQASGWTNSPNYQDSGNWTGYMASA